MKYEEKKQTTIEIYILGAVIAKTTMQSVKRHGILADIGISMLQYGVLVALGCQKLTIGELSKIMMVDPSTLVSVIDALDRKGLAERKRDPNDRRRVPISITQKGTAIVAGHPTHGPFSAEDNPLVKSIDAMGEEKAQQLLTLLRELVSHLPEGDDILKQVSTRVQFHATGKLTRKIVNKNKHRSIIHP